MHVSLDDGRQHLFSEEIRAGKLIDYNVLPWYSINDMNLLQKLTLEQRRVLADIFITTSQVTFGIAWATLLFPPLDAVKGLAILVSVIASVILWYFALFVAKNN